MSNYIKQINGYQLKDEEARNKIQNVEDKLEEYNETLADHNEMITAQGEGLTEVTRIAEGVQELVDDFNSDIGRLYSEKITHLQITDSPLSITTIIDYFAENGNLIDGLNKEDFDNGNYDFIFNWEGFIEFLNSLRSHMLVEYTEDCFGGDMALMYITDRHEESNSIYITMICIPTYGNYLPVTIGFTIIRNGDDVRYWTVNTYAATDMSPRLLSYDEYKYSIIKRTTATDYGDHFYRLYDCVNDSGSILPSGNTEDWNFYMGHEWNMFCLFLDNLKERDILFYEADEYGGDIHVGIVTKVTKEYDNIGDPTTRIYIVMIPTYNYLPFTMCVTLRDSIHNATGEVDYGRRDIYCSKNTDMETNLNNYVTKTENSGGGVDIDSFNRLSGEVHDLEESIRETDQQLAILQDNIYTQSDLDPYLDEVDTLKNNFEQTEGRIQRLEEDSVDLLDRVADLENSSPSSGGNSYKFKMLDRIYIGPAWDDTCLNLSQYMTNFDELMIIVRSVVSSNTQIGISNTSNLNNSFLASTAVTGTTYTKIIMNKTDEGNYAWTIGSAFGWSTSSAYSYLKYYTSSSSDVDITIVIHGR